MTQHINSCNLGYLKISFYKNILGKQPNTFERNLIFISKKYLIKIQNIMLVCLKFYDFKSVKLENLFMMIFFIDILF